MHIRKLFLQNFRNFERLDLQFEPCINIIYSPNGSGKTNIIEAISYLSIPKSFRGVRDRDLIRKDIYVEEIDIEDLTANALSVMNSFTRGVGEAVSGGEGKCIEFFIQHNHKTSKTLTVDGGRKQLARFVGSFNSVLFTPEVIDLINCSPGKRRGFLDRLIAIFDPEYIIELSKYKEVIRSRNKILSDMARFDNKTLEIWNEAMAEWGSRVLMKRVLFFNEILDRLKEVECEILKKDLNLSINYLSHFSKPLHELSTEEIMKTFSQNIQQNLKTDIYKGSSQIGPHRDDFEILINNYSLNVFGSRGQQRMGIIAMLFSYIYLLEKINKKPVILLDDVFSELDSEHRMLLTGFIAKNQFQVIITTTEIDKCFKDIKYDINFIDLTNVKNAGKAN